jgi:hypothetical protein
MKEVCKYFFALLGFILLNVMLLTSASKPSADLCGYSRLIEAGSTERKEAAMLSVYNHHTNPFLAEESVPFAAPVRISDVRRNATRTPARLIRFNRTFATFFMLLSNLTRSLTDLSLRTFPAIPHLSFCPVNNYYVFLLRELII